MKIKIRIFGELLDVLAKDSEIELENSEDLGNLVAKFLEKTRRLSESRLLQDTILTILINSHNIHTLNGFDTTLNDEDTVTLISLVVGG